MTETDIDSQPDVGAGTLVALIVARTVTVLFAVLVVGFGLLQITVGDLEFSESPGPISSLMMVAIALCSRDTRWAIGHPGRGWAALTWLVVLAATPIVFHGEFFLWMCSLAALALPLLAVTLLARRAGERIFPGWPTAAEVRSR
ncbi:hypothetical protein ACO0E1_00155 [Curtobacterium sp. RRHDQ66]|uniref:hypothetical protein n=1 Tax=Curtobacterium guangdongense TaxID=3413380 RepID=UPI003BF1EACC